MDDQKDRLGKKLEERERAEEERWIAEQEKAKLERLRAQAASNHTAVCPKCGTPLQWAKHHGVAVDECPKGHGFWIAADEITTLAQRERDSWIGRYAVHPRLVTD